MLLEQKNAVIYGAGGAVGAAVARAFAREGARVFLTGRTAERLNAIIQDIVAAGGRAEAAVVDAHDQDAVERHLGDVIDEVGRVDISFNAIYIGYQQGVPLVEMSLEEFVPAITDVMRTQFITTTAAARRMIAQHAGVILAITATPARVFAPDSGNFGVAGAAIERLCRQLAGELGPHGVRVACLRSAGSPDAPVVRRVMAYLGEQEGISGAEFEARVAQRTLLKRLPKLAEIADAAVMMASEYASGMTGTVANVTCGEAVD